MSIVRPLLPGELPDLLALYAHLHANDEAAPSPEVAASIWHELLGNPRYTYLGAFEQATLVASCTITVIPNLTRGCRPYAVIENVVTHTDHRRRGHGRAVVSAALAHAWSVNCYKTMLSTGRKTESTFQFYGSVGFSRDEKQAFIARPPACQPSSSERTKHHSHKMR